MMGRGSHVTQEAISLVGIHETEGQDLLKVLFFW